MRMHAKAYDITGQPIVYRSLAKTSDEWLSRFFYFVTVGSFTADGGSTVTDGECKDNTSKDPFFAV